jgi:hypothetical protein
MARTASPRIENQRQRGREEQPEGARRGQQAERKAFAVAIAAKRLEEQSAKGQDGDPRAAGEDREEGAQDGGDNRRTTGHPAEQGSKHPQETSRRFALGKREAGQGKERDGREKG